MKGKIVDEILSHFMRNFKALCNKSCKECKDKNVLISAKGLYFHKDFKYCQTRSSKSNK